MKIDENQKYLLAIARAFGLSFSRFCKLRTFFAGDFKKCFLASVIDWQEATIDQKGIDKFFATRGQVSPDQELEKLQKCGGQMLICGEDNYPQQLTKIYSPPALLFLRGKILPTDFPSISVVGSRKISAYGKRACYAIVSHLSQQGITIVSGLAYGVDVLSHRTAVETGGRTIAVSGSAIDQITPQQNENFAKKFLAEGKGVILSEYLPGSVSRPEQFAI